MMKNQNKSRPVAGQPAAGLLAVLFAFLTFISLHPAPVTPAPQQANPFLIGAYFKVRQMIETADRNIARLEAEIRKNREVAARARSLMEQVARRTDDEVRRAGQIAAQALKLAEESAARNEKTLTEWQFRKATATRSLAEIQRLLKKGEAGTEAGKIQGLVSSVSGRAEILKADGRSLSLDGGSPAFLEPGDSLKTADGLAELQGLGGRATTHLARDSELSMLKGEAGEESYELLRGRLHCVVDRAENFAARLKQGLDEYKEDLGAIRDYISDEQLQESVGKQLKYIYRKLQNKTLNLKIPTAVLGVRGTEFILERDENGGGQVWVLDGEIEITFSGTNETIKISAGQKCSFTPDSHTAPVPFDSVEKWWEK